MKRILLIYLVASLSIQNVFSQSGSNPKGDIVATPSVEFDNAGQYSFTTCGYDDVTYNNVDWISVGVPNQGGSADDYTYVKYTVTPHSLYNQIDFCPPSNVSITPSYPNNYSGNIKIENGSIGQEYLRAKSGGCSGTERGKIGIAVYEDPHPITRYFVITQVGETAPTDYPSNPRDEIRNRWRQGVATPTGPSCLIPVTCDYDNNRNGVLEWPDERQAVSDSCAAELNYNSHDDYPDEIWIFYVKDVDYPGADPAGISDPLKKECAVQDLNGSTHSTAITTAHEWGHCVGRSGHENRDGTVMRGPGYTQGDLITKPSWDAVTRP